MYSNVRGGVFLTSCSDGGDGSNSSSFTSTTKEIDNTADVLGKVTDSLSSSDANKATAAYNADKSKIVITSKAAGEATITAKETAEATDSATIKIVVASDGKITATVTKKIGEGQTAGGETVTYAFDDLTSVPETVEGENSILDGKVIYWVAAGKTGNAKVTANSDATHHYLQVSAGGAIAADATTVDIAAQTTYLKVKAPKAGKEKITFTFTTVKGGSDSQNRILIVDPADGKILGQTAEVSCGTEDDNTEKTLSVEATVPETFLVVFARSNGKGGFKFTKFEQVNTDNGALASIAATTTKSEYAVNEDFDASKVTVTATYANGKTATVTGWTSNADTAFNKTTAGSYTITITYKEGEVTKTCELPVTVKVKALASIAVKTNPTKTEYTQGDTALDLAGLVITLTYDDNTTDEVAYSDTTKDRFATSGFDSSAAAESQAITVTYGGKTTTFNVVIKAKVYFKSFVAGTDTGKTADSSAYETITSTDGLVTMGRSKYQANEWSTRDYNAETGAGYKYTARVKVNKTSGSDKGELTIKNVKIGDVLRFDGGNSGSGDRKMTITGADETVWTASASSFGSFYLTATAETVVLTSADNEFSIYGIHVVPAKVATTVVSEETTYSKPVVVLSAASVVKDAEVTVTTTIPKSVTKKTYSDGKIEEVQADVTAEITYTGATVTDGKVNTSTAGTYTITASYKIGETPYTSDPVTLEVAGAFTPATVNVTNNEATLGLKATEENVSSSAPAVATAAISGENIVITSVAAGTAIITAGNGTNSATIEVTVAASGAIEHKVKKYSAVTADSWDFSGITTAPYTFTSAKDTNGNTKEIVVPSSAANIESVGSYVIAGKNNVLNLVACSSPSGAGMVTTKNPQHQSHKTYHYGIKNDALKIEGVSGKVKVTIVWSLNSSDNRTMNLYKGTTLVKSEAANGTAGEQTKIEETIETENSTLYISTSNTLFITSITIEAAQ